MMNSKEREKLLDLLTPEQASALLSMKKLQDMNDLIFKTTAALEKFSQAVKAINKGEKK